MTKEDLKKYKKELKKLSEEEKKERNKYLKDILSGEIQGPIVGDIKIDQPWVKDRKITRLKDLALLASIASITAALTAGDIILCKNLICEVHEESNNILATIIGDGATSLLGLGILCGIASSVGLGTLEVYDDVKCDNEIINEAEEKQKTLTLNR